MTNETTDFLLAQIPRRKLTESVAEQLLQAIRPLAPGTRLPSERDLMQQLGVGRSTVREALKGLALLGVLEIRHGQGMFVAAEPPGVVSAEVSAELAQALTRGITHDLLEARAVIEVALARLAAARRTQADLQEIEAELESHARLLVAGEVPMAPASRFHSLLAQAAQNDILLGVFQSLARPMLERGPRLYETVADFARWELDQHQYVFAALRAGDAELAGQRMGEHVAAMAEYYRRAGLG